MSKRNKLTKKEFATFLGKVAKWTAVFLAICITYWALEFLLKVDSSNEITIVQSFGRATDTFHEATKVIGWLFIIPACIRALFPKQTKHLGDYLLLGVILTIFLHAISQLVLGTCIITLVPHILYERYGLPIPDSYAVYRWNPFGLPNFMVVPYYIAQIILGFYLLWKMHKEIFEN